MGRMFYRQSLGGSCWFYSVWTYSMRSRSSWCYENSSSLKCFDLGCSFGPSQCYCNRSRGRRLNSHWGCYSEYCVKFGGCWTDQIRNQWSRFHLPQLCQVGGDHLSSCSSASQLWANLPWQVRHLRHPSLHISRSMTEPIPSASSSLW